MTDNFSLYPSVEIPQNEKTPLTNESGEIKGSLINIGSVNFMPSLVEGGFIPDPRENLDKIKGMEAHPDDILVCAYMKSGTHWLWEMVSMIVKGSIGYQPTTKESYMLEFHRPEEFKSFVRPRILNTHLPFENLPKAMLQKRCKILFIQRNIKDMMVSGYYNFKNFKPPLKNPITWPDYIHFSMTGQVMYQPWYQYISGFEKELDGRTDHILPLFFEDLKKDPVGKVLSIAKFLNKECQEEFACTVADRCSFKKLKEADKKKHNNYNMDLNFLYRKGEVGDWKNLFTVAQNEIVDSFIKDKLANSRFKNKLTL